MRIDGLGNLIIVGTLTQGSDARGKHDIHDADDGLDIVRHLQPKRFTRNLPRRPRDYHSPPEWPTEASEELGFVAQDVQDVLPDAVSEDDGQLGITITPLIAVLVNAVKELADRVEELENAR